MTKQFEKEYQLNVEFTENKNSLSKQQYIRDEQIRIQNGLINRPPNIKYFEDLMYNKSSSNIKDKIKIGYFCNMISPEIIRALGAVPVRLDCGNSAAGSMGEEIIGGEICPLARASLGIFLNEDSLANSCDLLILPTSCDAKKKLGEILNDFKPVFMYNLPPEQNHKLYAKQSFQELLRLVKFIENECGLKLKRKSLHEQVKLNQKQARLVRKIGNLRIKKPRALLESDFFLIIQSLLFRPTEITEWLAEVIKVIDYIYNFESKGTNIRSRIVLTGAPIVWPNFKALNVFEECGVDVVADTICTGGQALFDPILNDENSKKQLLYAISNRYVYASICPCFISQTTRVNRILELVNDAKADGVINYSLRLCQLFDIENYRIEKTMKSNKVPYLNIRTDYSLEDTEQLRVRIEAFVENL